MTYVQVPAVDANGASMGPRLFSRGNAEVDSNTDPMKVASMGPRLFSRGNNSEG